MAPSASMLFLSYHQLHRPAEPRREEVAAAPGGGLRMSVRSVLSLALFQRRPEAVRAAEGKAALHERDDAGEEIKSSSSVAAAADANKELESKLEEAVRLSCWSS